MKKSILILFLFFTFSSFSQTSYEKYHDNALSELINGNLQSALTNINEALSINPREPDSYYVRGNIYQKQNLLEKALEDYLYTLKLNPKHTDATMKTAIIYGKIGDKNKSCLYLVKACNLGENKACQGYNKFCN